uniref:G_PROTEIN_RECEP_F1_2 domain-containing protein n=1 Tax=Rhabditophanes sp. KR3021 TaxID=114890 RepID=A0AC35U213_9BILA
MLEYSDINLSDIILFVIYIGICIVGLIGNFSVLYILSFEKSVNANNDRNNTSKSTKTFIANLAIADILFLICCIPATALNMSHLFPDSKLYCTTQFYMAYICSAVSSWTFCSLAINRFVAVVHPHWSLKVKDNNFIFIGGCALIWILSFGILVWYILPTPQLVYATADWHNGSETILSVYCLESLEIHNKSANETAVMLFYMGYSIFSFILPLTGTSFFYFAVFSHLKKVANNVQRSAITPEHQSRINKIILKVVFTFTACWLPLNIKYLIQGYSYPSKLFPEESFDKSLMIVNTIIQLMAYSNACMNPILYCFMLPKCRERLNNIISQFCCYIFTFFGLFNYSKNTSIPAAYKLTAIEYERYNALASTSETNVRGTYAQLLSGCSSSPASYSSAYVPKTFPVPGALNTPVNNVLRSETLSLTSSKPVLRNNAIPMKSSKSPTFNTQVFGSKTAIMSRESAKLNGGGFIDSLSNIWNDGWKNLDSLLSGKTDLNKVVKEKSKLKLSNVSNVTYTYRGHIPASWTFCEPYCGVEDQSVDAESALEEIDGDLREAINNAFKESLHVAAPDGPNVKIIFEPQNILGEGFADFYNHNQQRYRISRGSVTSVFNRGNPVPKTFTQQFMINFMTRHMMSEVKWDNFAYSLLEKLRKVEPAFLNTEKIRTSVFLM